MRNDDYFKGKRIAVAGFARSGLSAANLLYSLGAWVRVTDNQDTDATRANLKGLASKDIEVELGRHTRGFIEGSDLVVVSPGVSSASPAVTWAEELDIPVVSEIEVAGMLCPATVIAVTGTSGKTTVTTLIGRVIEESGSKVFVCGNIGNPFCGEVSKMKPGDFVSLEISSFQLERTRSFKPKVALILNVSRNHLDRHASMQEYIDAKKMIFRNQDASDFLVLNSQCPETRDMGRAARSKIVYFSGSRESDPNQAAVIAAAGILGIGREACLKVFAGFQGLEHRMEEAAEINGVRFINDSKATTADSTAWALGRIPGPVILIAGGRHKGVDYRMILEAGRGKVKEAVLIGEAKGLIRSALEGEMRTCEAGSLEEAVTKAYALARPGDCILLSPMCSSFDMFANYEERGRAFKEIVSALEKRLPV